MRRRHIVWLVPATLLAVAAVGCGIAVATIDPDFYKPRIIAAVRQSTGRDFSIGGRLELVVFPRPGLRAAEVALANPPGFSRPQMVTAAEAELQIALLPLLRREIEIARLTLTHPDLLLEIDAGGRTNWQFAAPSPAPADTTPVVQPAPTAPAQKNRVRLDALRLEDGRVTLRQPNGQQTLLQIARLDVSEAGPDEPIRVDAAVSQDGRGFTLAATLGSWSGWHAAAAAPWPVKLELAGMGAALAIAGSLTQPAQLAGYRLDASGHAADLSALDPRLPALRDVRLAAHLEDVGGVPQPGAFSLEAGASDLSAWAAGLSVAHLRLGAEAADRPVEVSLEGSYAGAPLKLDGHLPAPDGLSGAPGKRLPLDLSAAAFGASVAVRGDVTQPLGEAPLDLRVTARLPDLAPLAPLLHRKLPALRDIAFEGRIADEGGSPRHGLILRGARLSLPQGDVSGEVSILFGPPPSVRGNLSSKRLDLDALRVAFAPVGSPAIVTVPAPSKPAGAGGTGWHGMIPDTPFDLADLHAADLDLQLQAGEILAGAQRYAAITGHALLQAGHLLIDRLSATSPAGQMALRLDVNAAHAVPTVALLLHAPGLSLATLLSEAGLGAGATGTLEVEADLHGTGASPHAIATTLNGSLGVAMVGGTIDNSILGHLFADALHNAKVPADLTGNGRSDIRCLAVRLDAQGGVAAVRALLLDMSHFRVGGAGTIDLGREMLALHLRPYVNVGGSGLVVPLRVTGSWRAPASSVETTGVGDGAAALAADVASKGSVISPVTSALASAGEHLLGDADVGNCAPSLALARDGRLGSQPAPLPPPKPPKPADLLRGLLRQK